MKKLIIMVTVFIFILNVSVSAQDIISIDDFDLSESESILAENGFNKVSIKNVLAQIAEGNVTDAVKEIGRMIYEKTIGNVLSIEKTIVNILLVILLSAFFTNFTNVFSNSAVSDMGFYICYLVEITIMITLFETFCSITSEFVILLLEFMGAILPTYFLAVGILGQASAIGFYQLALVVSGVCQFIFLKVAIPLVKVYLSVSLVNNISKDDFLSKMAALIGRFVNFINKAMIGMVTGLNLIQGLILPSIDKAKNTTIRKFIGSLPVVGDGTEAVSSIVFGSVNLIKNTLGVFVIVIILAFCLIPFIQMQLYSASLQMLSAIVQPVADKRILEGVDNICKGTGLLAKIIWSNSVLFIISIAIICITTGGT